MSEPAIELLIHGKVAADPALRAAIEGLRASGLDCRERVTAAAGDAERFARQAAERGASRLIACGGDGTLSAAVSGLLAAEAETALGIVPMGTANDFATANGLVGELPPLLERAARGPLTPIDVGLLDGEPFLNVVSGGLGAEVSASASDELKQAIGGAAYSLVALLHLGELEPVESRVEVDGALVHEGPLLLLAVGNGRLCGGGYALTPHALLDDGQLDLTVIQGLELAQLGALTGDPFALEASELVVSTRGREIAIETERPFALSVDGEPQRAQRFRFGLHPRRLPTALPADSPLLQATR